MKRMLIDANHADETRVAIVDRKQILEFDYASANKKQIKGNIYLAKVTRVEPSLQAAFVEYGGGRQGFLPFSEIHPDYYQIPVSDRKKLIEEVERELQEDAEEEEAEFEARQSRTPRRRTRRVRGRKNRSDDDAADDASQEDATAADAGNDSPKSSDTPQAAADDSNSPPDTQYAKKEDPSISSDIVSEHTAQEDANEANADADTDDKTVKKTKARRPARPRGRPRKKVAEEDATQSDEQEEAGEAPAATDARLAINAPVETRLGAALFSEDDPFEIPGEEKKPKRTRAKSKPKPQVDDASDDISEDSTADGDGDNESIETMDSEEESTRPKRKKNRVPFFKRYKIQEVIKRGQVVLVQATKEERGNKGASVTTYLSLAGRYCVLMPNSPRDGGVSRKISDNETRKRLKDVMSQLTLAQGMSVIIRTAGIDRSRTEIRRDFDYLVQLWNQIRDGTLSASAPELIYEENNLIKRAIRDLYTSDIDEVLVEGEEGYVESRDFMKMLMPSHTARVKQYKDDMPLYYAHGIEDQLASMHDPMVKLKSGGYLIINPTEALISIDVNSGRSTGERNIEETAIKTNVEAAHEVARQLRLRDLSGLIVIDFIDMMDSRNRRSVERNLKDALRSDRAKIQVGRISPFGLMEMSRQRLRPSIGETMHTTCPSCAGRGLVHAPESLALHIVRTLEKEAVSGRWSELKLLVSQSIALYLLNSNRMLLTSIERQYGVDVTVDIDASLAMSDFTIEKVKGERKPPSAKPQKSQKPDTSTDSDDESTPENDEERPRRRRTRGGRGRGAKRDDGKNQTADNSEDETDNDAAAQSSNASERSAAESKPASAESKSPATEEGPDNALPEFTKQAAVKKKEDKVVETEASKEAAAPPPDTSRPKNAPARKGWWSQMIELD